MNVAKLLRLLQLASPALPIGGFGHSQGLEAAVEQGVVVDEASVLRWTSEAFEFSVVSCDIPMLRTMHRLWSDQTLSLRDRTTVLADTNAEYLATREAAELRAASVQMGYSLRELLAVLPDVPEDHRTILRSVREPSLPCVWSAAASAWQIESRDSAAAYAWSWAENQVLAAIKTVPLGQSAGQRVLLELGSSMGRILSDGRSDSVTSASNFAPALAILSSQHETQYSRLFRS